MRMMTSQNHVLDWLLEDDQPAVRYYALVDLMDFPPADPAVEEARAAIPLRGWAAEILRTQKPGGYWGAPDAPYYPKYDNTTWKWIVLGDLGLTAKVPGMRESCELFLERNAPDGGFGRKVSHFCVTGNFSRTLIRAGYRDDRRVRSALDWLVDEQKSDGGWHCFDSEKGTLDCWEALAAFGALGRERLTRSMKRSVERGSEFYLERKLHKEGSRKYAPWFRFHYPTHYYYDILVGLDVLTALGYGDDRRLEYGLKVLREKRQPDGRWHLDAVHPDLGPGAKYSVNPPVTPFALEEAGMASKWITLTALRVLKRVEGEVAAD